MTWLTIFGITGVSNTLRLVIKEKKSDFFEIWAQHKQSKTKEINEG